MQLLEAGVKFKSVGGEGAEAYSVASNAKVMDMFSDKLYGNKVRAPIRELSTNAWDAHIMAGSKDKVPVVKLPTQSDPTFSIRDFGTGLSKEDMKTVYKTYGESTKSHTDLLNGCWGIGSKSPFAYTRSFVATSYHKGRRYMSVSAKNASNVPMFEIHADDPTNEPDGLEVSFVVKPEDIYRFSQEAREVYRWFPVKFNVTPKLDPVVEPKAILSGPNWKITGGSSTAIMGWICYPIETHHFQPNVSTADAAKPSGVQHDWYKHYAKNNESPYVSLLNVGIQLDFEIGEVEMDISREKLQYTPKTIETIKARLDEVYKQIQAQIEKEYAGAKNWWEAAVIYKKYTSSKLDRTIQSLLISKFDNKELTGQVCYTTHKDLVTQTGQLPVKVDMWKFYNRSYGGRTARDHTNNVTVDENVKFIINDQERGAHAAVYRLLEEGNVNRPKAVYLCKFASDALRKTFNEVVGIDDSYWSNSSALPKPLKKVGQKKKVENVFDFVTDNRSSYNNAGYWKSATIDFKKGGYYVEVNSWQAYSKEKTGKKTQLNPSTLFDLICRLKKIGVKVPTFYGIKTVAIEKYQKSKNWNDIYPWIKEAIEKYIVDNKISDTIAKVNLNNDDSHTVDIYYQLGEKIKHQIKRDTDLHKLIELACELRDFKAKNITLVSDVSSLALSIGIVLQHAPTQVKDLDRLQKSVMVTYPFFEFFPFGQYNWCNNKNISGLVNAIKLVDSI